MYKIDDLKQEMAKEPKLQKHLDIISKKRKRKINYKTMIFSFVLLLYLSVLIFLSYLLVKNDKDINYIIIIGVVGLVIFLIVINFYLANKGKQIQNFVLKYATEKYGPVKYEDIKETEIVDNDFIANYNIIVKILKYKCKLRYYVLQNKAKDSSNSPQNYFIKGRYVEYMYNLSGYNKKIDKSILEKDRIKIVIDEFFNPKSLELQIKDDYLIIKRKILLDYKTFMDELKENLDDVELFYNILIIKIIELLKEE